MLRDDPQVVVELRARFAAYEQALRDSDLVLLASFFDDGEGLVRFGIADRQRGAAELAAWRASQPPIPPERTLAETTVSSFGADVGVVSTLFSYPGRPLLGRQSQTWVRLRGTWKIVHAHVSEVPQ